MIQAFLLTFGVVFLAELGDKSQFVVLAFASRFRALDVLLGVTIAAAVLAGASVLLGATVAVAIPTNLIAFAGGVLFLAFAVLTLRAADDAAGDEAIGTPRAALARSAVMTVRPCLLPGGARRQDDARCLHARRSPGPPRDVARCDRW
jgi:putative Ca2+/H+ antiporter (TMEM165/GDT1 family)